MSGGIRLTRMSVLAFHIAYALSMVGCTNLVISDPSQLPRAASNFVYPGYQPPGGHPSAGGQSRVDMSAMQGMPGTESKPGTAVTEKPATSGHDMSTMQGMRGVAPKEGGAQKPKAGAHDMRDMQGMPRTAVESTPAAKPYAVGGHGDEKETMQSMPGMAKPGSAPTGPIAGTGVVKGIDKVNGKIRITHDPIQTKGWPRMTVSFRLKANSLADRVKEGDSVAFTLEKLATGYLISDLRKNVAGAR